MTDSSALAQLSESLDRKGLDVAAIIDAIKRQRIETPSWGYADSGTRFKVFHQPGAARNVFEKLQDAACVHRFTGVADSMAIHVLWDFVDAKTDDVVSAAQRLGIRLGAVNPTLFERDEYKLGSLGNPRSVVREQALAHCLDSVEIMREIGSDRLSLWFADGTNYPGQDDLIGRKHRMAEGLKEIHDCLDDDMEMLLEYKFFEPAFYSTDVPDWGTAYILAKGCGPKAKVLVDLGHHPQGTNIEQIVALLTDEAMLGGFHFNSRKYADDDLAAGSMSPYELFLIFNELVAAAGGYGLYDAAYMIDQSHNVKPKVEAMIQSVMSIQQAYAKALCVNRPALREAQLAGEVVAAEEILKDAFETDVRPLLAATREEMDLAPDPLACYRASVYQQKVADERS